MADLRGDREAILQASPPDLTFRNWIRPGMDCCDWTRRGLYIRSGGYTRVLKLAKLVVGDASNRHARIHEVRIRQLEQPLTF